MLLPGLQTADALVQVLRPLPALRLLEDLMIFYIPRQGSGADTHAQQSKVTSGSPCQATAAKWGLSNPRGMELAGGERA